LKRGRGGGWTGHTLSVGLCCGLICLFLSFVSYFLFTLSIPSSSTSTLTSQLPFVTNAVSLTILFFISLVSSSFSCWSWSWRLASFTAPNILENKNGFFYRRLIHLPNSHSPTLQKNPNNYNDHFAFRQLALQQCFKSLLQHHPKALSFWFQAAEPEPELDFNSVCNCNPEFLFLGPQ
jgi:hypothetical protein